MKILLIGIPGLYQNWLRKILDPTATIATLQSNFIVELQNPNIAWDGKFNLLSNQPDFYETHQDTFIVNSVVNPENFPWYLHNFYGKTDEIFINLDKFEDDFFTKARDTQAFGNFFSEVSNQYNINETSSKEDIKNALIEAIYLTLVQTHPFRNLLAMRCPNTNSINIEYGDFGSLTKLRTALKNVPGIDLSPLSDLYAKLKQMNDAYINSKKYMLTKLASTTKLDDFNVIQQAIIGYAIHGITGKELDWYNTQVRYELFDEFNSGVAAYLA